jgi:hypothetical protein
MDEREQKSVFKMFLNTIDERDIKAKQKILEWVDEDFKERFNGRQIRNILSSAMALARAEERPLELRDIKRVRDCTKIFQDHLHEQTILAKRRNE